MRLCELAVLVTVRELHNTRLFATNCVLYVRQAYSSTGQLHGARCQ